MKRWRAAAFIALGLAWGLFRELEGFSDGYRRGRARGWEEGATVTACAVASMGRTLNPLFHDDVITRCMTP